MLLDLPCKAQLDALGVTFDFDRVVDCGQAAFRKFSVESRADDLRNLANVGAVAVAMSFSPRQPGCLFRMLLGVSLVRSAKVHFGLI